MALYDLEHKQNLDLSISLNETQILKGVAIFILLYNHLFAKYYGSFPGFLFNTSGLAISIFLFVSGYGLTISYKKIRDLSILETLKFQARRYVKFYANFWVIFLIFVPLGVFVFNRGLSVPYEDEHCFKWLIMDFFGLMFMKSYNITWWFNVAIVFLYLLFPLFFFAIRKVSFLFPILWFFLWLFCFDKIIGDIAIWSFHFCFGILIALNINKISKFFNHFNWFVLLGILIITFIGFCLLRQYVPLPECNPFKNRNIYGAFITVILILTIILSIRLIDRYVKPKRKIPSKIFVFIGNHSRNIYLIHTFIYLYFFSNFINSFKYQTSKFLVLLGMSLAISIIIEFLKEKTKYKKLEKYIVNKI
jgi:peptidoglycan/LPS O-acetylase OafA/YrhL